jgi:hypothetical protein
MRVTVSLHSGHRARKPLLSFPRELGYAIHSGRPTRVRPLELRLGVSRRYLSKLGVEGGRGASHLVLGVMPFGATRGKTIPAMLRFAPRVEPEFHVLHGHPPSSEGHHSSGSAWHIRVSVPSNGVMTRRHRGCCRRDPNPERAAPGQPAHGAVGPVESRRPRRRAVGARTFSPPELRTTPGRRPNPYS